MDTKMDYYLYEIIEKINVGKAILFTGAGFSRKCININNSNFPLASDLAKKICKLGEFPESKDLNYASERYKEEEHSEKKLISMLKNELLVKHVSDEVKNICTAIPWYKIYTTNYDNVIESCLPEILPLDLTDNTNDIQIQDKRCLHINGYIKKLSTTTLNNGFYLSNETSVADIFNKSAWSTVFKNDIDRCSCLIFIGYSLSDFELQKIIYNTSLKEHIYFVVNKEITNEEEYKYKKFGKVVPLGTEGFSQKIMENSDRIILNTANKFKSIKKYELTTSRQNEISDNDIIDMFVYGKINIELLEKSVLSNNNYVIFRNKIEKIAEELVSRHVLITSDLGNGKTLFIKELLPVLSKKFKNIYIIDDYNSNCAKELEEICTMNNDQLIILVIDDYDYFIPLLSLLLNYKLSNIRLILTSRTNKHYKNKQLFDKKIEFFPCPIDLLNDTEIEQFIKRLDTIGFWEKDVITHYQKTEELSYHCNRQISSILLRIFNSQEIKNKIEEIKTDIFKNDALKQLTFVALFIGYVCKKTTKSLLHSIIGNDAYSDTLTSSESFNAIFHVTPSEINSFSNVFNQKFLQEFFDSDYTIKQLLFIAEKVSAFSQQDNIYKEILKNCLKFSVIERVLQDNKREKLINYYDKIKRIVTWLEKDPHYWLQYGMGYLSFKEYDKTEKYFTHAYNCAKNKGYAYDVENIDTQSARLNFMKSIDEDNIIKSYELFRQGHNLINHVTNSKYKYRQLIFYEAYYKDKYSQFDTKMSNQFFEFCRLTKEKLPKFISIDSTDEILRKKRIEELDNIMTHIKSNEGNSYNPIN